MATIEENRRHWQAYDWSRGGEEWSEAWGGSAAQWWTTIWPRVRAFLPAARVLEIAPGFGRFTARLAPHAGRLEVVDLSSRCIEACRERFRDLDHLRFHVNEGRDLSFAEDGSFDFVFSFDSLVHAEREAVGGYVADLARVLRRGGTAFLHHSNVADLIEQADGGEVDNPHWRATTVGARWLREEARRHGLRCRSQELVGWGGPTLFDCLSVISRDGEEGETRLVSNPEFMREAEVARGLADLYPADEPAERRSGAPG